METGNLANLQSVEAMLRDELAHGNVVISTSDGILRHLLANDDNSIFSDEVLARVRGMLTGLSEQVLHAYALLQEESAPTDTTSEDEQDEGLEDFDPFAQEREVLITSLSGNPKILPHLHALALEFQLVERLQLRNSIDPVLSPLIQELIASKDAESADLAMTTLTAQSRFMQYIRRMELPLSELPAELFGAVLECTAGSVSVDDPATAARLFEQLKTGYDESQSRLGLMSRLVHKMGRGAIAALNINHAGAPMFLTALSIASAQPRDIAVSATTDRQLARLALSLCAAGLKPEAVEEQFIYLHPTVALPEGFEQLRADRAAALLTDTPLVTSS